MWLGEKITDKGIGNGISLLIMVGIIATMPQSFVQEWVSRVTESNGGLIMISIELVIWVAYYFGFRLCWLWLLEKLLFQYARRTASGSFDRNVAGTRQYIPLRLNASGVMPIIFAQALMFVPSLIGQAGVIKDTEIGQWMVIQFSDIFGLWYNIVFGLLIIVFTYFYTAITVPTNKIADDLKRSGGFIPGIRPGTDTSNLLDTIMSHITLPGSIFLALVAVFPAVVVKFMDVQAGWALFFGGTSLLIMVGVAIDTMQQVNSVSIE
jgi:preprotein translocase subunit SecY